MGDVLFSDLGLAGAEYNYLASGWFFGGSGGVVPYSSIAADFFTVAGTGNFAVSQIDLAVVNYPGELNTFFASIWSVNGFIPGTQVPGAYWTLSTPNSSPVCCSLTPVTGITGVTLTGGQSYFLLLGPLSTTDASNNYIVGNNQGVTGIHDFSIDGGATWLIDGSNMTIGAFDVLGTGSPTPEPESFLALGVGVLGIWAARRARLRQPSRG
jgi:hypothetical protein